MKMWRILGSSLISLQYSACSSSTGQVCTSCVLFLLLTYIPVPFVIDSTITTTLRLKPQNPTDIILVDAEKIISPNDVLPTWKCEGQSCTMYIESTSPLEMILIFEMVENMSSQPFPDGTAVSLEDVWVCGSSRPRWACICCNLN